MKLFLVSAMTSFVCATASAQSFQPFDVVNPIGDENLGNIIVKSPQDPGGVKKQIVPFNIDGNMSLSPSIKADETRRVSKGTYCVAITPTYTGKLISSKVCDVKVEAKKTTTVAISALKVEWDPAVLVVDVGPQASFEFRDSTSGFLDAVGPNEKWMQGQPYSYWPLVPGTVTMKAPRSSLLGTYNITLQPGEVRTETVSLPDLRASIEVLPPQRAYADPTALSYCPNHTRVIEVVQRSSSWNGGRFHSPGTVSNDSSGNYAYESSISVDWTKGGTYKFFPKIDQGADLKYELVVNNTWMPVNLQARDSLKVQVKRIDVNDVLVSREDGTTFYAPGMYTIYYQDPKVGWKLLELGVSGAQCAAQGGRTLMTAFPTKTGIDVLPGVYKVVTKYKTQEGDQVDEQVIDLR